MELVLSLDQIGSDDRESVGGKSYALATMVKNGMKVPEAKAALLPLLPDALFPGGDKAGWWLKAVQLDLEAKGLIERAPSRPVQLSRTVSGT